jgi:hypothetical protein
MGCELLDSQKIPWNVVCSKSACAAILDGILANDQLSRGLDCQFNLIAEMALVDRIEFPTRLGILVRSAVMTQLKKPGCRKNQRVIETSDRKRLTCHWTGTAEAHFKQSDAPKESILARPVCSHDI